MPHVFHQQYTRAIPSNAERISLKGKGSRTIKAVRFKDKTGRTVTAPLTRTGDRCRVASPIWYGQFTDADGIRQRVPLCENKAASEAMLAEMIRKASMGRAGFRDPFEAHRKRPLVEHLADFHKELAARDNAPRYVDMVVSRLRTLLDACGFQFIGDISASHVADWLADLRRQARKPRAQLPPGQEWFTAKEAGRLLGIKPASFRTVVYRNRLAAEGSGKARRYPRATVAALQERVARGASAATSNAYLSHLKSFCRWLVKDRRTDENFIAHLDPGNVEVDRRHDRRELDAEELRRLLTAARDSERTFRGLTGPDRFHLYATACGTGLRASGLASLTPEHFDLDGKTPTVTLAARHAKNRKTKVQPLAPDVADLLRVYLADRPAGLPVWNGTWASDRVGAEMLRIDLDAAGIPYTVEGPDGPLFADFHALRHSYLTLGGRAGIDLRTLQELAGHSTPTLTARYSHRRLHDLAGAVEKLPSILPTEAPTAVLQATGTTGAYTPLTQLPDSRGGGLRIADVPCSTEGEKRTSRNTLNLQGVEAGCEPLIAVESRAGDGIRTHDVQLGKRVFVPAKKHRNPQLAHILRQNLAGCKC